MKFSVTAVSLAALSGADAFVQRAPQHAQTAVRSYLDDLGPGPSEPVPTNTQTSGAGISSYLDSVVTAPSRAGGAGFGSYLDTISQACDAVMPIDNCAEAITDYLGALATGDAPAASVAAGAEVIGNYLDNISRSQPSQIDGAGIPSYLDSVGSGASSPAASAPAVKSFLDALSGSATAPVTSSSPAPPAAPSAPVMKDYLDALQNGSAVEDSPGAGIFSYLSTLPSGSSHAGGAGIASYLDSVPESTGRLGGAGFTGYLDSVTRACDGAKPTDDCADAITDYMGALSSGDESPTTAVDGAQVIGSYLDTISRSSTSVSGPGLMGHLDSLGGGSSAIESAPAVMGYLDGLRSGTTAAPSAPAVKTYLDAVSSGNTAAPTTSADVLNYGQIIGFGITRYS